MLPTLSGLRLGGLPVEGIAQSAERERRLAAETEKRFALVIQQQRADSELRLQLACQRKEACCTELPGDLAAP